MHRRTFLSKTAKLSTIGALLSQHATGCDDSTSPAPWPEPRNAHATAFNTTANELLIFGGMLTTGDDNCLWSYNATAGWSRLSCEGPAKREDALLIYHTTNQKAYLIGGRSFQANNSFRDFWEWDGSHWTEVGNNNPFGYLAHAAATYDEKNDRILIFGGLSANGPSSDLWMWDENSWTRITASGPTPRLAATMVYSPSHEKVFLFGGTSTSGKVINEVWELDGETWTKSNETFPKVMAGAYGVAPFENRFVQFGGFRENMQSSGETMIYDPSDESWSSIQTNTPGARSLHSMVYNPIKKSVLMFGGGASGVLLNDLWEFDNEHWTEIRH